MLWLVLLYENVKMAGLRVVNDCGLWISKRIISNDLTDICLARKQHVSRGQSGTC